MRRGSLLLLAAMVFSIVSAFGAGQAADCGPNGSPANGSGSCETENDQVRCGPGQDTGAGVVSASTEGGEYCNEGDVAPVQGRVGAQHDCDCAYVDGDDDNTLPLTNGWARVDVEGLHCRETGRTDNGSYNTTHGTDGADCVTQFLG